MAQIILVSGNWFFDNKRWLFAVDKNRGTRILQGNRDRSYEDFVRIVYEDYGLDHRSCRVVLSYMFSKKLSATLPIDTPPIIVGNDTQLQAFLGQKSNTIRLCVEVEENNTAESMKRKEPEANVEKNLPKKKDEDAGNDVTNKDEDGDDDGPRFDYCDDSDGTDSGDENFSLYGMPTVEEEEEKPKLPIKKRSSGTFLDDQINVNDYSMLELSSLDLAVGQCYETKEHLETRLKLLTVVQKFDFFVDKSTPHLLIVKCWVKGCTWRVRATPLRDFPKFHVRMFVGKHTCSVTERSARCRQATPDILGALYKDFVGGVGPKVLPMHVAEAMNKRFQIKMEYWKAYRTLVCARKLVIGTPENGFQQLPSYLYGIKRANPGTFTRLEVDEAQRFKYLFLSFGASIVGFQFMRKVVVVDGTFLQGRYKGTLLTATAQDGNFQIFPIAFAVVDTENDESWEWFFKQLNYVIPDDESLAIISDRHKSIEKAIKSIYPKSNRGICTYHMYKNILVRFKGRDAFGLVKKAANAFRLIDFQACFDQIEALNPALHTYLERADVRLWARVHFPGDRYNLLTSNIAESINRVLSHSRSLPIVHLLDAVRSMMTRWFSERRTDAFKMKTSLTRGVEKLLQNRVEYAKVLTIQDIDADHVQVMSGSANHIVNLREKKCMCCKYNLEKLPCAHAIAAAEKKNISRIEMCHHYYHKTYLYNAYANPIMPRDCALPVPENIALQICEPPVVKPQSGRPKKSRTKSALEIAAAKKRPRKEHTCGNCGQTGHNRRLCNHK